MLVAHTHTIAVSKMIKIVQGNVYMSMVDANGDTSVVTLLWGEGGS